MLQIILTVGSLLLVAIQTYLLRKTYRYNCDWQEKEKAIELSAYYKDEILPSVEYIGFFLRETGIMECLRGINQNNIDSFNQNELYRLTSRDIESQIDSKRENIQDLQKLINLRRDYNQITQKPLHAINPQHIAAYAAEVRQEKNSDGSAVVVPDSIKNALLSDLWFEFDIVVSNTLNSLEYFSMNFITGVADDSVVFQSLHQTFIVLVQMLYYYIAMQNTNEKDIYYTNIIGLYKRWVKKDYENEQAVQSAIPKTGKAVRK